MRMGMTVALAGVALLAGCNGSKRETVAAEITGDSARGRVILTCRESTSGTCYALFQNNGATQTTQAAVGASSTINGIALGTRFCVAAKAPDSATCQPRDLADGRQIVRHDRRESR